MAQYAMVHIYQVEADSDGVSSYDLRILFQFTFYGSTTNNTTLGGLNGSELSFGTSPTPHQITTGIEDYIIQFAIDQGGSINRNNILWIEKVST